jgi:transcription elongation GreA/GreB family factor
MGSVITYITDDLGSRTVRLIFSDDATQWDRVSILGPLRTALLGVTAGDKIPWSSGNRPGVIRVLSVCGP